jgi:DNA-binding NarL/FixJ family response regulator
MPGMSSEEVVTETVKAYPDVPVAVISGYADARQARAALDDGARGFIPKTMGLAALSRIIDLILAGETYLPSDFSETHHSSSVDEVDGYALLSPREREVFALLPKGLSNKEIARELGLRDVTVKVHLKHIYQKLDVSNRTEAAVMALRFVGR